MKSKAVVLALALFLWSWSPSAAAKCNTSASAILNVLEDIVWDCIFPISIAGIPVDFGNHPPDSTSSNFFCQCPGKYGPLDPGFGFLVEFWEPARMIDTVSDAWCFPGLGLDMEGQDIGWGYNGRGAMNTHRENLSFAHYHYYVMPIWGMLDLFTDIPCLTDETQFDLAAISEVRPDWHDDLVAAQFYPETALMANPATVLSCVADAVAATAQRTIDALYWCMGSWETTYPMTGNTTVDDHVESNAATAGRAMFLQARNLMLPDRAVNYCYSVPMPIWVKSHWRIQQTKPRTDNRCHSIGHPGIFWTHRKNPVGGTDNFTWIIFRKVRCCVVFL